MLLTLDLGNTNLTVGVFSGDEILVRARISTRRDRTGDEWGLMIAQQIERRGITAKDVEGAILASVVPPATNAVREGCLSFLGVQPVLVDHAYDHGVQIAYSHPEELGADRIVNAAGALARFAPPLLVVDFGTATTFDAIDGQGRYLGGAIAPGINVSTEALFQRAALLHRVRLQPPERAIGRTTEESLQSGIVLGFAGQVDALVRRMQQELGGAQAIATGGLAELIAPHTETLREIDQDITLRGLHALYARRGVHSA
ncbi:MAG: type III pantothenate kinase [Thermaerobacter sp.]|nr:type III pantothenate kinase [Thermaerobacter sp.]